MSPDLLSLLAGSRQVAGLGWVAAIVLTGVLALRALIVAPAVRRVLRPAAAVAVQAGVDRRLLRLATVAAAVLLPATLLQLVQGPGAGRARLDSLLTAGPAAQLGLLRLLVTALALITLLPVALHPARYAFMIPRAVTAALALGLLELTARAVPAWPTVSAGMTLLHLLAASVWAGGLAGMAVLATATLPEASRRVFWPAVIRRFLLAAACAAAALSVSGLWLYWVRAGGPGPLLTTGYGRILGVKLLLVGGLLALGMVHELWLMPRVEAFRAVGDGGGVQRLVTRQFRGMARAGTLLAFGVLMIVPLLSGPAGAQPLQTARGAPAALSATAWAWGAAWTAAVLALLVVIKRASRLLALRRISGGLVSCGPAEPPASGRAGRPGAPNRRRRDGR